MEHIRTNLYFSLIVLAPCLGRKEKKRITRNFSSIKKMFYVLFCFFLSPTSQKYKSSRYLSKKLLYSVYQVSEEAQLCYSGLTFILFTFLLLLYFLRNI